MKACYICEVTKELEEFYKDKHSDDGRTTACKECSKKRAANMYSEIKGKLTDRQKARRKAAYQKWKDKNPDKYKAVYEAANKKRSDS